MSTEQMPHSVTENREAIVSNQFEIQNIVPEVPVRIPSGASLNKDPSELVDVMNLGFSGSLTSVVDLGPLQDGESWGRFYVFDRGESPDFGGIANLKGDAVNMLLRPNDGRFVVISDNGLRRVQDAVDRGGGVERRYGWRTFSTGDAVTIGRKTDSEVFNEDFSQRPGISREHVRIAFDSDGSVLVEDLHSTNGTRITKPAERAGNMVHDTERTLDPEDFAALKQHMARQMGRPLTEQSVKIERVPIGPEVGSAEKPLKGEDTILRNDALKLFGIFDGAGGHGNGDIASRKAAEIVESSMIRGAERMPNASIEQAMTRLKESLMTANRAVSAEANGGVTTGSVIQLHEQDGEKHAIWAMIGDSSMYRFNKLSGALERIGQDESLPNRPNVITNALGTENMAVRQLGALKVREGDVFIIGSDGVWGDKGTDVLSQAEISQAVRTAGSAQEASNKLLGIARKRDDKSVIVFAP